MAVQKSKPKMEIEMSVSRKGKREPSGRGLVPTSSYGSHDGPYNAFLDELEIRQDTPKSMAARRALASSTDPRFLAFLNAVDDSRFRQHSLASIAKQCQIALVQFGEFWQKAQRVRAIARAQEGIVDVTNDMIEDARSVFHACERCDGYGYVLADAEHMGTVALLDPENPTSKPIRNCPACNGLGKSRKPGDAHSRDKLLEMTDMTGKKSGGASIHLTQNFGGAGMESAVDLNKITYDIEAETIDDGLPEAEPTV